MANGQQAQTDANRQTTTLRFLGTAAGDWPKSVPPEEEANTGNRDYRRFAAAVVNDHILIDFGPTLPSALGTFNVDPRKFTDVLLTHSHWDHMDANTLQRLVEMRAGAPAFRLWGHVDALRQLPRLPGVEFYPVQIGFSVWAGGYEIEPLAANHWVDGSLEQPLLYLFTRGDEQWLYATDTAWFPTPTMRRLEKTKLDAIIWDATYGDVGSPLVRPGQFGHNTLGMIRMILPTLAQGPVKSDTTEGAILKPGAPIWLTHLSRGWHPPHEELARSLEADGLIPAYDGMVVHIPAASG